MNSKFLTILVAVSVMLFGGQSLAYDTRDEMIDDKLRVMRTGTDAEKITMLERLQWAGLGDERLYDEIAKISPAEYTNEDMVRAQLQMLAHRVRALGYSGKEKYRELIQSVQAEGGHRRLRGHAKKAAASIEQYRRWNEQLQQSELDVSGKSFEVGTYMKMMGSGDVELQRVAARAVFYDQVTDSDALKMIANKLEAMYLREGLSKIDQDTAAWFSKALGVNARDDHLELLRTVVAETPYKKIRKHTQKYIQ